MKFFDFYFFSNKFLYINLKKKNIFFEKKKIKYFYLFIIY